MINYGKGFKKQNMISSVLCYPEKELTKKVKSKMGRVRFPSLSILLWWMYESS